MPAAGTDSARRHLHALDHTEEAVLRSLVLGSFTVAGVAALGTFAPSRSAAFLERMQRLGDRPPTRAP